VFLTSAVPFLSLDPSLKIPRDSNTASLRLYLADDYSDLHLYVEYREKSVLSGLSAVGGFWTVLNGLFATVFGTTLMFVLFGESRAPLRIADLTRIFRHQASLNVRVDT
jgi:hypothetical protein